MEDILEALKKMAKRRGPLLNLAIEIWRKIMNGKSPEQIEYEAWSEFDYLFSQRERTKIKEIIEFLKKKYRK